MAKEKETEEKKGKKVSLKEALVKYAKMRELEQQKSAESKAINDRIGSLRKMIDEHAAEASAGQKNLTNPDYSEILAKYHDMRELEKERATMQSGYNEQISAIKKELDEVAHVTPGDDRQGDLDVD